VPVGTAHRIRIVKVTNALLKWITLLGASLLPFIINLLVGWFTGANVFDNELLVAGEFLFFTIIVSFETFHALFFCEHKGLLRNFNFFLILLSLSASLFAGGFYFLIARDNLLGVESTLQIAAIRSYSIPIMIAVAIFCGYSYVISICVKG